MKFDTKHYMSAGYLPDNMEWLQRHFPNLKEYGGYIKDIDGLKIIFKNEFLYYLLWSNADQLFRTEYDINKVFTKDMLDYIKNTLFPKTCRKNTRDTTRRWIRLNKKVSLNLCKSI